MIVVSPHTADTLSPLTADQSWVMFVQLTSPCSGSGPIKIEGVHGTKVSTRLNDIAVDNAYETYLIGLMPTPNPMELAVVVREQYAAALIRHDWYEPTAELVGFIRLTAQQALTDLLAQAHPGGVPDHAVDIDEIAVFLGVSVPTVRRLVKGGTIPHLRMGRALRFVPADVLASLERNQR